jgi:1-acyl-sn-glycerol-3-phosphate acyltransferase
MPARTRMLGEGDAALHAALVGVPSPRAPRLYRLVLALCRLIARILGWRLVLEGAGFLPRTGQGGPAGSWIAAGFPHRTWVDPFVLVLLLPVEPRLIFLGDGRVIVRSWLRRAIFRRIGGIAPIWPGGRREAFEGHVGAARSVIDAGAVFALFPEVGPPVPVDRARPFSAGIGYFALRTGAPIVPLVLGGTHELFLGRRIILRVLPPLGARELAGLPDDAPLPPPGSAAERSAAHRIASQLHARSAAAVADAHRAAEPPAGAPRRLRRLTGLFH